MWAMPPGRGRARMLKMDHIISVAALVISGALSGALMALAAASIGSVVNFSPLRGLGVLLLLFFAVRDLVPGSRPIQLRRWQVPSTWMKSSRYTSLAVWGWVLGAGVFTFSGATVVVGLWVTIFLVQEIAAALMIGLTYGTARTLSLALYGTYLARHDLPDVREKMMPLRLSSGVRIRMISALSNIALAASVLGVV